MFSNACKYGIRGVMYLAMHYPEQKKHRAQEIAEALDLPRHFLAKVLQTLSKEGLISSVRGPGGGFYLSEEDRAGSILSIVEAIDGNLLDQCVLGLDRCSSSAPCPLHFQVFSFREGLRLQLEHQSIESLARSLSLEQIKSLEL